MKAKRWIKILFKVTSLLVLATTLAMPGARADEVLVTGTTGWYSDGLFLGDGSFSNQTYALSPAYVFNVDVTDYQWKGDMFTVIINGATLGDTSTVTPDAGYRQYDPQLAFLDSNFSKGVFTVNSGGTLTILAKSSPFGSGNVAVRFTSLRTSALLPLIAAPSSPATLTSSGSSLTCSPGKYQVGSSEVAVTSYIYKLYLNNQLVSVRSYDPGNVIPSSMMGTDANLYPATISSTGATYDLSKASDYTARCEVTAVGYSSSVTTSSATISDSAYQARLAKQAADEEAARLAAVAANYSKEARDARAKAAKYENRRP